MSFLGGRVGRGGGETERVRKDQSQHVEGQERAI